MELHINFAEKLKASDSTVSSSKHLNIGYFFLIMETMAVCKLPRIHLISISEDRHEAVDRKLYVGTPCNETEL